MLDKEMDLVMITDRMDESLVVLKELVGWEMSDIMFLNKKVTQKSNASNEILDATDLRIVHATHGKQIFEYFSDSFDRQIEQLGKGKISVETERFRKDT